MSKVGGAAKSDMAALGIPVQSEKAPANATRPAVRVDTGQRLQHTIHWTEEATPDNKRKPRGAMGAEIWAKFDGPPPIDETECTFLTLDAFTPYKKNIPEQTAAKWLTILFGGVCGTVLQPPGAKRLALRSRPRNRPHLTR